MTTRNFRVNTGLSVGDIAVVASTNAVTGVSSITLDNTTAPGADGVLANKKYVDDELAGLSATSVTSGTTNITVSSTKAITTISGATAMTIDGTSTRIAGNLIVDGTSTQLNTSTLSVEDNIIEVNRGISSNSGMPTYSGMKVNRGETSTATEQDLFWVWDESYADNDTTTYGNAGGAFTALRSQGGTGGVGHNAPQSDFTLVDIRANVIHATSTSAQYADVAERFEADAPMSEGAVVEINVDARQGASEITEATTDLSDNVFGVISTQPAYAMNALAGNGDSHPFVAMTGRTPVRVTGTVNKGQRLVSSSIKGTARAVTIGETISPFHVIGRALENKADEDIGLVNCAVRTNN
jgi:hypothetical protein